VDGAAAQLLERLPLKPKVVRRRPLLASGAGFQEFPEGTGGNNRERRFRRDAEQVAITSHKHVGMPRDGFRNDYPIRRIANLKRQQWWIGYHLGLVAEERFYLIHEGRCHPQFTAEVAAYFADNGLAEDELMVRKHDLEQVSA